MATDEVVTVVAAPATAADDDSDEELHPADKKMLPLAGAITAAATESPDMTKNNDRLVAAMTAALAVVDTVEDLKALVDHLPTSGEFKLTCYMLSYLVLCVHERPLNLFMPPPQLIKTHNPPTPLILYSCTHNPPTPIVFASPVLPSGASYSASVSMNRLIKHLKEVGSLPEETGNYGQMKKSKKGLNALWSTVSSFFGEGSDDVKRKALLKSFVVVPTEKARSREVPCYLVSCQP